MGIKLNIDHSKFRIQVQFIVFWRDNTAYKLKVDLLK